MHWPMANPPTRDVASGAPRLSISAAELVVVGAAGADIGMMVREVLPGNVLDSSVVTAAQSVQ